MAVFCCNTFKASWEKIYGKGPGSALFDLDLLPLPTAAERRRRPIRETFVSLQQNTLGSVSESSREALANSLGSPLCLTEILVNALDSEQGRPFSLNSRTPPHDGDRSLYDSTRGRPVTKGKDRRPSSPEASPSNNSLFSPAATFGSEIDRGMLSPRRGDAPSMRARRISRDGEREYCTIREREREGTETKVASLVEAASTSPSSLAVGLSTGLVSVVPTEGAPLPWQEKIRSNAPFVTFRAHEGAVLEVATNPHDDVSKYQRFFSAGEDGVMRLWDCRMAGKGIRERRNSSFLGQTSLSASAPQGLPLGSSRSGLFASSLVSGSRVDQKDPHKVAEMKREEPMDRSQGSIVTIRETTSQEGQLREKHNSGRGAAVRIGEALASPGSTASAPFLVLEFRGHEQAIEKITFASCFVAVTGSRDGTARVWNLRSGDCLRVFSSDSGISSNHFSSLPPSLEPQRGTHVEALARNAGGRGTKGPDTQAHDGRPSLGARVDGKAGDVDRELRPESRRQTGEDIFNLKDPKVGVMDELREKRLRGEIVSHVIVAEDLSVYISCNSGMCSVWDIETGECLVDFEGHTKAIVGMALLHRETELVTASEDGTIRWWLTDSGQCIEAFDTSGSRRSSALSIINGGYQIPSSVGGSYSRQTVGSFLGISAGPETPGPHTHSRTLSPRGGGRHGDRTADVRNNLAESQNEKDSLSKESGVRFTCLTCPRGSSLIVAATSRADVLVFSVSTRSLVASIPSPMPSPYLSSSLVANDKGLAAEQIDSATLNKSSDVPRQSEEKESERSNVLLSDRDDRTGRTEASGGNTLSSEDALSETEDSPEKVVRCAVAEAVSSPFALREDDVESNMSMLTLERGTTANVSTRKTPTTGATNEERKRQKLLRRESSRVASLMDDGVTKLAISLAEGPIAVTSLLLLCALQTKGGIVPRESIVVGGDGSARVADGHTDHSSSRRSRKPRGFRGVGNPSFTESDAAMDVPNSSFEERGDGRRTRQHGGYDTGAETSGMENNGGRKRPHKILADRRSSSDLSIVINKGGFSTPILFVGYSNGLLRSFRGQGDEMILFEEFFPTSSLSLMKAKLLKSGYIASISTEGKMVRCTNRLLQKMVRLWEPRYSPCRPPPAWVSDRAASSCMMVGCGAKFSFSRRRHHCRLCGGVFCSKCAAVFTSLPRFGLNDPVRVCRKCGEGINSGILSPV